MPERLTTEVFITRSNNKHENLYSYSNTFYSNARTKVIITCIKHGDFEQIPSTHLNGGGCIKCYTDKNRMTWNEFEDKAILKHGDRFEYIPQYIKNAYSDLEIICKKHGVFKQKVYHHLRGNGCPKCIHQKSTSKPELEIQNFIKSLKYEVELNNRELLKGKELDIYIPLLNKAIEFNGMWWHYNHKNPKCNKIGYHAMKSNLCREKGIKLLHIREDLWNRDKEKMKEIIIKYLENGISI